MTYFKSLVSILALFASATTAMADSTPTANPGYSLQVGLSNLTAPNTIPGFTAVSAPVGSFYTMSMYAEPAQTVNLGSVVLGNRLSRVLAVQNSSGKDMTGVKSFFQGSSSGDNVVSSMTCTPPFSLTTATPGEVCDLVINFTPTVAGQVTFSIKSSATTDVNELGESTFNFVVNVIDPDGAVDPSIIIDPPQVDFSATTVGSTSFASVLVYNGSPDASLIDLRSLITGDYFNIDTSDCGSVDVPVELAGGSSCLVSLSFSPVFPGNFIGTLSLDAANSANGTQSALLVADSVDAVPDATDLSVSVSDSVSSVFNNTSSTYTITVTNLGVNPANFSIANSVSSSGGASGTITTSLACVSIAGVSCSGPAPSNIELAPGSTAIFRSDVSVGAGVGSVTLQATITPTGTVTDENASNNSASDSNTVVAQPSVDLATTAAVSPSTTLIGSNATFTVTYSNPSVYSVAVNLSWSVSNGTLVSSTKTGGAGTVTSTGANSATATIPANSSVIYQYVATATASSGLMTLTASQALSASSTLLEPNTSNNSATASTSLVPLSSDLSVSVTDSTASIVTDASTVFTTTVLNTGSRAVEFSPNQTVSGAILSAGPLQCMSVNGVACSGPASGPYTLNAGATAVFRSTVVAGSSNGTISHTGSISVSGAVVDSNSANNSATDTTTVVSKPVVDLVTTVTSASATTLNGSSNNFTVTFTNTASQSVTANLSWSVTGAGTQGTATKVSGTATVTSTSSTSATATIPGGGSAVYSIPVTATATSGTLTLSASSVLTSATLQETNTANNTASASTTMAPRTSDLAISVTDSVTSVASNGTLTYTITVSNTGANSLTFMPSQVISSAGGASLVSNSSITCLTSSGVACSGEVTAPVTVNAGTSSTFRSSAVVGTTAGSITNTVTATVSGANIDTNAVNNTASDTTSVVVPTYDVSVSHDVTTTIGTSKTITVTSTFTGTPSGSPAPTGTISGTFVVAGTPTGGSASVTPGTITCGTVVAGGTCNASTGVITFPSTYGSITVTRTYTIGAGTGTASFTSSFSQSSTGSLDSSAANNSVTTSASIDTVNTLKKCMFATTTVPVRLGAADCSVYGCSSTISVTSTNGTTTSSTPGGALNAAAFYGNLFDASGLGTFTHPTNHVLYASTATRTYKAFWGPSSNGLASAKWKGTNISVTAFNANSVPGATPSDIQWPFHPILQHKSAATGNAWVNHYKSYSNGKLVNSALIYWTGVGENPGANATSSSCAAGQNNVIPTGSGVAMQPRWSTPSNAMTIGATSYGRDCAGVEYRMIWEEYTPGPNCAATGTVLVP